MAMLEGGGMIHYDFITTLLNNLVVIPLAGILAGGTIVYFLEEHVRKLPLWSWLLIDTLAIVLLIIIISIPGSLAYYMIYFQLPPWDGQVMSNTFQFLTSYGLLNLILFWSIVSAMTLLLLRVNEKYGQGVFLNMLRGAYHRPKVETRIFMFLDIRSSTSMAERLGHEKWFDLLNRFFNDITDPIIDTHGEIYQYVGDEVIVSWSLKHGLTNNNCVQCFFEINKRMNARADEYLRKYGVVPRFKAGIHCGPVTMGEIGKIKRDIVFTGDVLNTTSRIQDLCNQYQTDLLVSLEVVERLSDMPGLSVKPVGHIELRGKQVPVSLFAVQPVTNASLAAVQQINA
jgi:adenylate cyclase